MLVVKAARLSHLVAFFSTHPMLFNDETEVVYNMLLRNGTRQHIVIMGKQKTHLLHIIADGTSAVMLYQQRVVQLLQATLCLNR